MLDPTNIALLIAIAFLLLVIAYYIVSSVANPTGRGAEKKTGHILSRFAALRQFKALSGVTVNGKNGEEQIEHLLIGRFGVLLVQTLGTCGEYYGRTGEENWTVVMEKGEKTTLENPDTVLERQAAGLLRQLTGAGITGGVPVHKVVYIPGHPRRTKVYVKSATTVLTAGKLKGYLETERFEKEAGVDVRQVAGALQQSANQPG